MAWFWAGLCLLALPLCAAAQPSLQRDVKGEAGGSASAGPYAMIDTAGQPVAGPASSSSYSVSAGFWGTFGSAPIPYSLVLTIRSNLPVTFPVSTLLSGSDADGDPLSLVSFSPASAQGGVVTLAAGNLTYTPPAFLLGSDSFTYTIQDTSGDTATGTVSLNTLAPIFTVTTNADSGPGSLRQALAVINAANTNSSLKIRFAPGLAGQAIALSNSADNTFGPSALTVTNDVVIDGSAAPGVSIAPALSQPMRLIFVSGGAQLTLRNITLKGGVADGGAGSPGGGGGGGGAGLGGAIYNQGTVTLSNVVISGNVATGGNGAPYSAGAPGAGGIPNGGNGGSAPFGFGGGAGGGSTCGGSGGVGAGAAIFNDRALLYMNNCTILNNVAVGGSGGIGSGGCNGTNANGFGAGLFNYNGMAHVTSCLFTNNNADAGDAIANLADGIASWVYLTQDTLTNTGSTNDFLSIKVNGGDAQTMENAGAFDSQFALWISPIRDVGTIHTNHPLIVPVVINTPGNLGGVFPLQAVSSDTNVVPNANLVFTGSANNFTLTITPKTNQLGTSLITVSADGGGYSAAATFNAVFGLFGNITDSESDRVLNVTADPGLNCSVEFTTNIVTPNWTALGQMTEYQPGLYYIIDTAPPDPARYYRILAQ